MAKLLWGLAASAMALATAQTGCMMEGKEYVETGRTDKLPNGAFVQNPYLCQQRCAEQVSTIGCVGFTWKEGMVGQTIGPKGCWLVSYLAKLEDTNTTGTLGRVVSGPPECSTMTGTTTLADTAMTGVTTAPVAPVVGTSVYPLPPTGLNFSSNISGVGGVSEPETSSAGGIPTWLIILILVAIVGTCIGVIMTQFGGKTKAVKKKKKKTRNSDLEAEQPSVVEAAPLLVEPASPVPASPASPAVAPMEQTPGSPSLPVPSLTAPVLPMPGMAAPQGYMQARQPVAYMQPMYPGAPMYAGGPRQIVTSMR